MSPPGTPSWLLLAAAVWLCACPPPPPPLEDSGQPEEDGGEPADAGLPDSGVEDAGPPADAGFGPVPIERWCESWAFAECARDARCQKLEPARMGLCMARRQEGCDQAAYSGAVAGGRLQYFAQQGARCLNAYADAGCLGAPGECEGLFLGMVPPDGGCILPQECDSQGFCFTYTSTCPFRCLPYVPAGGSCNSWDQRCDPQAGTCQLDGGIRACAPPKGLGEPCDWDDCRADLSCYIGKCVQRRAKVGEACQVGGPYPFCEPDAFCREGPQLPDGGQPGTCQKRMGLGGVCTGYAACLPNLRCSSTYQTGTCVELGSLGDTCTGYGDCKDELYCATRNSRCAALPGDGGDCTSKGSFFDCAVGHYCDFSAPDQQYTCTAARANGVECTYDGVCQSQNCERGPLPDGGTGWRCAPPCSQTVDGGY
ncbi:MAG: hypothetical protein HYZ28_09780 [Myxococcales bacterium]|nr:hypothetical protein [Myxococcales bacterium]